MTWVRDVEELRVVDLSVSRRIPRALLAVVTYRFSEKATVSASGCGEVVGVSLWMTDSDKK